MSRICIHTKDIQLITGKSERYARTLIAEIKEKYGKTKDQAVTVKELCKHLGINEEDVQPLLK